MFCIVAFIFLSIMGLFSASYRDLAKKAWGCFARRMSFRRCDMKVQEELKTKLIGGLVIRAPRLYRFLNRWLNLLAWILVILTIWSLVVVVNSGLNLLVYDTCNPRNAESCSLGGEACSIVSNKPGFIDSLKTGQVLTWVKTGTKDFATAVSLIPSRFKNWDPKDYISDNNTYYREFDPQKPIALEIIDPSCIFCAKLFGNIKSAQFDQRYNLTYLVYPIPNPEGGYKFPHSYLIASYMEAVKRIKLDKAAVPPDWQLLEKMFTGKTDNIANQDVFNVMYDQAEAEGKIKEWLKEIGYNDEQISRISQLSKSDEVAKSLEAQKNIVEQQIKTRKIPTIIFEGRRFDRLIDEKDLK